ncbi:MAG: hypothetical protein C4289_12635 [Chloroflexota bacterium]
MDLVVVLLFLIAAASLLLILELHTGPQGRCGLCGAHRPVDELWETLDGEWLCDSCVRWRGLGHLPRQRRNL